MGSDRVSLADGGWQPNLAPFICPECGGGFTEPRQINTGDRGVKDGCPWCGETSRYDLVREADQGGHNE